MGDLLIKVLRGGETLGALTLSRFFAVHVLFLPAVIVTGIALHMIILRLVGPAGPWDERKAASRRETFYPRQVYMDAVVMLLSFLGWRHWRHGCRSRWRIRPIRPTPVSCRFRNGTFSFTMSYSNTSTDLLSRWSHGYCRSCSCSSSCSGHCSIGRKQCELRHRVRSEWRSALCSLLIVFSLLGVSLKNLYAVKRADPGIAHGKALYTQFGCAGCHRIHGEGGALAPDLSSIGDARPDREWHVKHLRDPQSVSPGSIMPKFPLTEPELNDLTSYMLSLRRTTS